MAKIVGVAGGKHGCDATSLLHKGGLSLRDPGRVCSQEGSHRRKAERGSSTHRMVSPLSINFLSCGLRELLGLRDLMRDSLILVCCLSAWPGSSEK